MYKQINLYTIEFFTFLRTAGQRFSLQLCWQTNETAAGENMKTDLHNHSWPAIFTAVPACRQLGPMLTPAHTETEPLQRLAVGTFEMFPLD